MEYGFLILYARCDVAHFGDSPLLSVPLQTDVRARLPRKDFGINGFLEKHNSINFLGDAGARTNQPLNLNQTTKDPAPRHRAFHHGGTRWKALSSSTSLAL
jgi:hypothetical protein